MQLFSSSETLEIENPEIANLFFEAFKHGKSFAKTTAIVIETLNSQKQAYMQYLAEYEDAYNLIKGDTCEAIDENPNRIYTAYLKYTNELGIKIDHIEFLKYETYFTFAKNQEQIFEDFASHPDTFSDKRKAEIKENAKEVLSLHEKFSKAQKTLAEVLEAEPVTVDDVAFVEQKIKEAKDKLATFPFSVEEDYTRLLENAKKIDSMQLAISEDDEKHS